MSEHYNEWLQYVLPGVYILTVITTRTFMIIRAIHLLDLILHLVYLASLMHYSLLPPVASVDDSNSPAVIPQSREYIIGIYAASQVLQAPRWHRIPYFLVLLAFLSCLPSVPFPEDYAYSVLLGALCIHVLQLHLPIPPSPFYLLPPEQILPLSTLLWHGSVKIFLPTVLFFLPAMLLALFLLSISLSDVLLYIPFSASLQPSPLEARTAFSFLLAITFILLISSLVMLILVYPSISSHTPASPWDRYSRSIGLDARRMFVQTVVYYSEPYLFVPPFSLVRLLVLVPSFVLSRIPTWSSSRSLFLSVERAVWVALMLPSVLVVASVWFWGVFSE